MKVSATGFGRRQPGGAISIIRDSGEWVTLRLNPEEHGLEVSEDHSLLVEMAEEILRLQDETIHNS